MKLGGWPVCDDIDEAFEKEWVERTKKMLKIRRFLVFGIPFVAALLIFWGLMCELGLSVSAVVLALCVSIMLYAVFALAIGTAFSLIIGDIVSCDSMNGWFYFAARGDRFCLITNQDRLFCAAKGERVRGVYNGHVWTHTWNNKGFGCREYRIKFVSSFTVDCDALTTEGLNYIRAYCLKEDDAGNLLRAWINTVVHFMADGEIWVSQKDLDNNPFGFRNMRLRLKSMKLTDRERQRIFEIR